MCDEVSYTVYLTRGAHVVRERDAERILEAVESRAPHVLVQADILGDDLVWNSVRIIVAHVVSIVRNEPAAPATRPRLTVV
jgi:tRNA U38,U39,U40 pseudouridine synthase TruA